MWKTLCEGPVLAALWKEIAEKPHEIYVRRYFFLAIDRNSR